MKLKDVVRDIKKATNAETIDKSSFAEPTGYLDSGSFAINRVLTGDIHKGFPIGRISTLFGLSQSGKSLISANTVINAIKNDQVDVVYIFDSEGGVLKNAFEKAKVDMTKINHIIVHSIEDGSVKMLSTYDTLVKARQEFLEDPDNNDEIRALCILDSYGALAADKLVKDAVVKDQMVQDMGLGAKLKNNLMRGLMMRVVESNATLLVINHEYQDPAAMFTSRLKHMAGGKGIEFASHVILQCEKLMVKAGDDTFLTGNENENDTVGAYKGNRMRFLTSKNRISKPFFTATVFCDFNGGISKYDGLIEDAEKMGYLIRVRNGWECPTYNQGKRVTYRELVSNDEIWNTFISDFNTLSVKMMSYSNSTTQAIDEIEKEIDEEDE